MTREANLKLRQAIIDFLEANGATVSADVKASLAVAVGEVEDRAGSGDGAQSVGGNGMKQESRFPVLAQISRDFGLANIVMRWSHFTPTTKAAIIIALGLAALGFLHGGIYESRVGFRGAVVYRTNRFTGRVTMCQIGGGCRDMTP